MKPALLSLLSTRWSLRWLAGLLAGAAAGLLTSSVMAIEEPRHRVIETVGAIQIREYEPAIVAEVEVEGERYAAINRGFRILARYIFGGNQGERKIAMTAPVTQAAAGVNEGQKIAMTAPVTQTAAGGERWRVTFAMPSEFTLESLPIPNDPQVRFRVLPPERRAVIVFDGLSTDANLGRHRAELERFVRERGLEPAGDYVMAFYNDPFTLPWNRRNEWWVPIR